MRAVAVHRLPGAAAVETDRFFVDTNVWKCLTYSKATITYRLKAKVYADFINACVKAKATLYRSALSYPELAGIIEKTECDIYNNLNATNVPIKKFREGATERTDVVQEVESAWQQVEALSCLVPVTLDSEELNRARDNFAQFPLDGYDVFFVDQMKDAGITAIITDDLDFIYVPGLHVYTYNSDSIGRAQLFKRLT